MKYIAICNDALDSFPIIEALNGRFYLLDVSYTELEDQAKIESEKNRQAETPLEKLLTDFLDSHRVCEMFVDNNKYPSKCIIDGYYNKNTKTIDEVDITEFVSGRVDYRYILRRSEDKFLKIYTVINNPAIPEPTTIITKRLFDPYSAVTNYSQGSYIPQEALAEYFPAYRAVYENTKIRRELSTQLDPNDSLSYIESQLDILTKIVLELVKADPVVKNAVAGFDEFEAAFASTNLLNIKSFDKCLGEITNLKARARKFQKEYYQAKESTTL